MELEVICGTKNNIMISLLPRLFLHVKTKEESGKIYQVTQDTPGHMLGGTPGKCATCSCILPSMLSLTGTAPLGTTQLIKFILSFSLYKGSKQFFVDIYSKMLLLAGQSFLIIFTAFPVLQA